MPQYIVHSGWWCDGSSVHPGATKYSDPRIRSLAWFDVWYEFVRTYTAPQKVIVVDSASPVRPDLTGKDLEFVSMRRNFLHGMKCDSQWGGWTRSFFLGAFYAYLNDVDYSVFVEQDCLLVGEGIVEHAIAAMGDKQISFALGGPNRSDQSFTIIRRDYIRPFTDAFLSIDKDDREMDTEDKFLSIVERDQSLAPLPFGYARNRPINFADKHFFAQQWRPKELLQLFDLTDFESLKTLLLYEDSTLLKLRRFVKRGVKSR
jgi:hypothetical protein